MQKVAKERDSLALSALRMTIEGAGKLKALGTMGYLVKAVSSKTAGQSSGR